MSIHRLEHVSTLTLVASASPRSSQFRFPGDGDYTEWLYLPILGPTSLLTYRRCVRLLGASDRAISIDLDELACSFGVRPGVVRRSIERLIDFHLAELDGLELSLQMTVPPVSPGTLERLTPSLRVFHLAAMHRATRAG